MAPKNVQRKKPAASGTGTRKTRSSGSTARRTPSKTSGSSKMKKADLIKKKQAEERLKREILGLLTAVLGVLALLSVYAESTTGLFGRLIKEMIGGIFGFTGYVIPFLIVARGILQIFSPEKRYGKPRTALGLLLIALICALLQAGLHEASYYENMNLGMYLSAFYNEGKSALRLGTDSFIAGGGVIGGVIGVPLLFVFKKWGTFIILITAATIAAMVLTRLSLADAARGVYNGTSAAVSEMVDAARKRRDEREYEKSLRAVQMEEAQVAGDFYEASENGRKAKILDFPLPMRGENPTSAGQGKKKGQEEAVPAGETASPVLPVSQGMNETAALAEDTFIATVTAPGPSPEKATAVTSAGTAFDERMPEITLSRHLMQADPQWEPQEPTIIPNPEPEEPGYSITIAETLQKEPEKELSELNSLPLPDVDRPEQKTNPENRNSGEGVSQAGPIKEDGLGIGYEVMKSETYLFPPVELLSKSPESESNMRNIKSQAMENAKKLESTLESFGIGAKVLQVSVGPAFTRYELQPAPGIKVSRIVNLTDDIALNLASTGVRIEAPIPGKAAIGVEVPNKEVAPINLRSVLETDEFSRNSSRLSVALGKDISGENVIVDLGKMPHVLIAGATGSGKSVCINTIVVSLLYKANPDEVKLLMVDPKVVELGVYNGIPHLLIPVVTDPNKAAGALRWAVSEMTTRYKLFADRGVRDLLGYNASVEEQGEGFKLPQIVIIIDELADLMMVAPHDVEDSICRLAQMARAAGMHLVIATQRPSVNVITGVIKANIPSRIAFAVSSQVDSRTILDMAGAEKLLGKGDMLYYPVGVPKPVRVKGAFVTDKEVELAVDFVKNQVRARYDSDIIDNINDAAAQDNQEEEDGSKDELLAQAIDAVIDCGQASVSFIQRKFKVGYARAGRIIDQMTEKNIISGYEGSKPRRILISKERWEEMKAGNFGDAI